MTQTTTLHTQSRVANASRVNPFQTSVEFILTDFLPNKNNQGIPDTEADNITNSAIGMPLKMNITSQGHDNAIAIGPIQAVWKDTINDRDVLMARASIWNKEYPEIAQYLLTAHAENQDIGTSWEVQYEYADQSEGIDWLRNVICLGTAIVRDPAYGKERTRVIAVAETKENMEDLAVKIKELEDSLATANQQLTDLEAQLTAKAEALKDIEGKLNVAESELTFTARASSLKSVFSEDELKTKREFILGLNETAFASYVADLTTVAKASKVSTAEVKVPNLSPRRDLTTPDDIATALKEMKWL